MTGKFASVSSWLEAHAMPCIYKKYFGIDCPGCGMQRAFIELLRGNLMQSLCFYPALIPTLLMIVFLIVHVIFKFKKGARILLWMFTINASIIIISYIYKQI